MSEILSSRSIQAKVLALAASAALLAGCSAGNSHDEAFSRAPIATQQPEAAPTTQADQVQEYINSTARNKRIATAVTEFGKQVVVASKNPSPNTAWAPFNTYCAQPDGPFEDDTWTSKGYTPKPGDVCSVQHNPQYGGGNFQIDADVVVDANGNFSDTFTDASISTENCAIFAHETDGVWDTSKAVGAIDNYESAVTAKTLTEAQAIDNNAIHCLNTTTYK